MRRLILRLNSKKTKYEWHLRVLFRGYVMDNVFKKNTYSERFTTSHIFLCRCIVPLITVLSPILDYGRCFIRHPYEHSIKLHNDSDLPAKYELVPQQVNSDTPIIYKSSQPKVKNFFSFSDLYGNCFSCIPNGNFNLISRGKKMLSYMGRRHWAWCH